MSLKARMTVHVESGFRVKPPHEGGFSEMFPTQSLNALTHITETAGGCRRLTEIPDRLTSSELCMSHQRISTYTGGSLEEIMCGTLFCSAHSCSFYKWCTDCTLQYRTAPIRFTGSIAEESFWWEWKSIKWRKCWSAYPFCKLHSFFSVCATSLLTSIFIPLKMKSVDQIQEDEELYRNVNFNRH